MSIIEFSYCFLLYFIFVSSEKIVINQKPVLHRRTLSQAHKHENIKSNTSKHTTDGDRDVLKNLFQIYRTNLQNKNNDLNHLLLLKQQYIVRNRIEEFETNLALDFVPDWSKIDKWSSTINQSIEIRRQKWQYILKNHSDIPLIQNLNAELVKSGINQSIFCSDIAAVYYYLSHNLYVYDKGPIMKGEKDKITELVHHPAMNKILGIFLHSLPNSDFKFNKTEDLIEIPKSLYHKLLRKNTQMELLKKHYETETKRKKETSDSKKDHTVFHQHVEIARHQNHTSKVPVETFQANHTSKVLIDTSEDSTSTTAEYDSILDSSDSYSDCITDSSSEVYYGSFSNDEGCDPELDTSSSSSSDS